MTVTSHETPTNAQPAFERHVDIKSLTLPPSENTKPGIQGIVHAITIESREDNADYPSSVAMQAVQADDVNHPDQYQNLGMDSYQPIPVSWRGRQYGAAISYTVRDYANQLAVNVITGHTTPDTPPLTDREALTYALAETIADGWAEKQQGIDLSKWSIDFYMTDEDAVGNTSSIMGASSLADLGFNGPGTHIDHDRFAAALDTYQRTQPQ